MSVENPKRKLKLKQISPTLQLNEMYARSTVLPKHFINFSASFQLIQKTLLIGMLKFRYRNLHRQQRKISSLAPALPRCWTLWRLSCTLNHFNSIWFNHFIYLFRILSFGPGMTRLPFKILARFLLLCCILFCFITQMVYQGKKNWVHYERDDQTWRSSMIWSNKTSWFTRMREWIVW